MTNPSSDRIVGNFVQISYSLCALLKKVGLPEKWCIWGKCFMLEVAVATLAQMISADLNGNFDNMIKIVIQ